MKYFITMLLFFIATVSFSQKSKNDDLFYLWDSAWNNVAKVENARFFTRVRFVNDTCWQHYNYKIGGPMLTLEEYKDREAKRPNGRFSYMRPDGTLDSIGHVIEGKLDGTWYFFSDTSSVIMKKEYAMGGLISIWRASDAKGEQNNASKNDDENESIFPGTAGSWGRYLSKNLKYPEAAVSKEIQGTVIVNFIIDKEGKIEDEFLVKSVEFTLDDEAIRLIKQSPKWVPAVQKGRKVKSYKKQPIQFRLK
ncbi:MAG: energy transducer TonB [Chitinophagaceae bacterium]|nr:energy transducer TonB [Chitinophagaceae bacterium]